MKKLYQNKISCGMLTFWDAGFCVWLGEIDQEQACTWIRDLRLRSDNTHAWFKAEELEEAAQWLATQVDLPALSATRLR